MHRPLLHALIAMILLAQGWGAAWAGSSMAGKVAAYASAQAELPPCHQHSAPTLQKAKLGCCGGAHRSCAALCGLSAATPVAAYNFSLAAPAGVHGLPVLSAKRQGFAQRLTRPPAL